MNVIKIKKGLNINLKGKPKKEIIEIPFKDIETFAVSPLDIKEFKPKLLKKPGDKVKAGTILAYDKNNPESKLVSPVSGIIEEVKRGEFRKILEIIIKPDSQIEYEDFNIGDYKNLDRDTIVNLLINSGLWNSIIRRPYGIVPSADEQPDHIHISTFDTAPLAQDYQFTLKNYIDEFKIGIEILKKLTKGKIWLNLQKGIENNIFESVEGVEKNYFEGKHPAGNVGIQIHRLTPINKGNKIWTLTPQNVVFIGRFFKTGKLDLTKIIALTGSEVIDPKYYKVISGASIKSIVAHNYKKGNIRFISGNVLTGRKVDLNSHLGFYHNMITVIPEGNYYEPFGWQKPGFNKFSISRTYFSWLNPKKEWIIDTNLHGGVRPFVFTGVLNKVLPMDILPVQLLKSIIYEDIEQMEGLGIYEVIEEDFALCEFVCISKINIQDLISKGISLMIKELGR